MRVPVAIYRQRKHKPPDTDVDIMDNIGSYTDIRSFEKCKCISICVTIPDKGQIKGGMSMKCKFCGNDLPEESKFCPSCGAPVEPEEKQEQSEQSAEAKQQENQNPYEYGVPGTDNGSGTQNENPYQYGSAEQNNENPYQYGSAGQNTSADYNANNGTYGQPQKPINGTTYLIFAIISTLLCCLPLGIVAIV